MKTHLTIIIFLALSFVSCGKRKSEHRESAPKIQSMTSEQMERLITQQQITCADQDFCPEGMARLFSINFDDNAQSSMCAGFLVAPDLVMTNSHCIWLGNIGPEKTCSGMYLAFPTSSGFSHSALCSKILWRDDRSGGSSYYEAGDNDFALIKLDRRVPVTPMRLQGSAITTGSIVYPMLMDQQNLVQARVLRLTCRVKGLNHLGVVELEDCPVISGNSGSVVVNENQEIVGIIFASSDKHVRNVSDPIEVRTASKTTGYAFTAQHFRRILSSF